MLISAVFLLKSQFDDFYWMSFMYSSLALIVMVIQLVALHKAKKLIEEKNYLGITIGLVISVMYLGGVMLPFGLWGLYCLLNREFMNAYTPENAPRWFKDNIIQSPILKF